MQNLFTEHPHSVGETYPQHFKFAFHFGFTMLLGGIACIVHAVFPFLFQKTGSNFLLKMTHHFVDRMLETEDRLLVLSQAIDKKIVKNKSV